MKPEQRSAMDLLDIELPADYLQHSTAHVAREKLVAETDTHSVVVFRVGAEWLALATTLFSEIAGLRPIHPLPQRRQGIVLGLANIRGELLPCVSLAALLGLEVRAAERRRDKQRVQEQRLLVLAHEGGRTVCPADEVYGVQRFPARALTAVPATLARATASYISAVLPWQNKSVGLLDAQLLAYSFNRSLASATAT